MLAGPNISDVADLAHKASTGSTEKSFEGDIPASAPELWNAAADNRRYEAASKTQALAQRYWRVPVVCGIDWTACATQKSFAFP